jgi:hypothetical protein
MAGSYLSVSDYRFSYLIESSVYSDGTSTSENIWLKPGRDKLQPLQAMADDAVR